MLLTAAGLFSQKNASASFAMAVMAREEHGRFQLLASRYASMSDTDTVSAKVLLLELKDHKPKLSAGQSVTPVPMSAPERKEWEEACLSGNEAVASAISGRIRARAKKIKPHQVAALHVRRMRAQYVDIDVSTGEWTTPTSITLDEADGLLRTIHAELANTLIVAPKMLWLRDAQMTCQVSVPAMGEFSHRFFAAAFARDA